MNRPRHTWKNGAAAIAIAMMSPGCEKPKPVDTSAECAAVRDLGQRSIERWMKQNDDAPAENAPITAAADHTDRMAKTAREIGEAFAKAAPKQKNLADTAEGVKMMGALAGDKLAAMASTVRDLGAKIEVMAKVEGGANDAVEKLGRDIAKNVGCDSPVAPGCAEVEARVKELDRVRVPAGFEQASLAAKSRAEKLDDLAKAIEALPNVPAKQPAREDAVKNARAGAEAFRVLAKALLEAAVPQDRLSLTRQEASEAATRLTAELEAAATLCGGKLPAPKPASTGEPPPRPSAHPPPAATGR